MIQLSLIIKAKINAIGKYFHYGLAEEYVCYTPDEYPEENDGLVSAVFKRDFLEYKKVALTESHIAFTPKAANQLQLSVGDIVKICFCEGNIIIDKYE